MKRILRTFHLRVTKGCSSPYGTSDSLNKYSSIMKPLPEHGVDCLTILSKFYVPCPAPTKGSAFINSDLKWVGTRVNRFPDDPKPI